MFDIKKNPMNSMFDILMGLPLMSGVSLDRMAKTLGNTKLHFLKYTPGEVIFNEGERCHDIAFIISGSVNIEITNRDGRFSVSQTISAPDVISPDFLFGKITTYPGTVTSADTVSVLRIAKNDYISILNSDPVFLFNYLNLLSMNAQKAVEGILAVSTGDIPERIAFWISALTQPGSTNISMECRQRDLVALFGVPRTSLKAALDDMTERGLIEYSPSRIKVIDRKKLLSLLQNHAEN